MKINMNMKIKSKSHISERKKAKASKPIYSVSSLGDIKITSGFEKGIIKDLYKFASKGKSKGIIALAEVEYPKEYKVKIEILNEFRSHKIIKKYKLLKPKEVEFFSAKQKEPSKLEVEVNPDVLFQQTPEDYDFCHLCNASVEFDPKTIIKHYKKICRRERVEEGFTNETVLPCDKLRLGLETGNVIYRDTVENFRPGSKGYNLLKEFLERPNRRRSTQQLLEVIYPGKNVSQRTDYFKKVKWFVNSIREKLEMYGLKPKNKDLFEACNGYRIKCRKK